jgi:histone H4
MPRGKVGTAKVSSPSKEEKKKASTKASSPKKVPTKAGSPNKPAKKKVASKTSPTKASPKKAKKVSTPTKTGKGLGFNGVVKRRRILRDNIQGITKPAIARLAHRAGIKRISYFVYEEVRGVILVTLSSILKNIIALAGHEDAKTLKVKNLLDALAVKGIHLAAGAPEDGKNYLHCKPLSKDDRSANKEDFIFDEIKHQQKNSNCLIIPRLNFSRLTREIIQDYKEDVRISKQFLTLLQLVLEQQLTTILQMSNVAAIHAGRQAVNPKDISLVRQFLRVKNVF